MELLGMAALHLSCVKYASYGISTGGLFHWRLNTGEDRAYSLNPVDYPKLPLFTFKGPQGSTSLLNAVFWLAFDSVSTWRSMSQLYCNVADMADLADSGYAETPAQGTAVPSNHRNPSTK